MAEIKIDPRQIAEPGAPDLSAIGKVYGMRAQGIQKAAHAVGDYVDSMNKLEAQAQHGDVMNQLNKELVNSLSSENIAQGNAYQRYIQKAQAIIEGGTQGMPAKYKKQYALDLRDNLNKLGLNVAKAELNFGEATRKAEGQTLIATEMDNLAEAAAEGDNEAIQKSEEAIESTAAHLKNVGAIDEYDEYKIKQSVKEKVAAAGYEKQFNDLLRSDPELAAKYQATFSEEKPDNLTHEQWNAAQSKMLKDQNLYYRTKDATNRTGLAEFDLAYESGRIESNDDIEKFVREREAEGAYFSQEDKLKMQTRVLRSQRAQVADSQKVLQIDNDVAQGSDNIYNYSSADLNTYYQQKSADMIARAQQYKTEHPDAPIPSSLEIKASVASKLPVPVKAFNNEMTDKLMHGTTQDFEEALKVGVQLQKNSPKTFSLMPAQTQAYNEYAIGLYSRTTLNPANIQEAANKAINEKTSETKTMINDALKKIHKTTYVKDLYKDVYGTKYVNPSLQPFYDNVSQTFDLFYQLTGDKSQAEKLTKDNMRIRSGKSKYIPPGDITKDPIEQTQLYQNHPTLVKNQMALSLYEVVLNQKEMEAKGYPVGVKVEWPDDIKEPDMSTLTEEQLYNKPFFAKAHKTERYKEAYLESPFTLKIDGENRPVYFINPNTNLAEEGLDQRNIYYEDKYGNIQPIMITKEVKVGDTTKYDAKLASLQFIPAEVATPTMAVKAEKRALEKQATEHLRKEYREEQKFNLAEAAKEGDVAGAFLETAGKALSTKEEETYIKEKVTEKSSQLKAGKTAAIEKVLKGKMGQKENP